MSFESEAHTMIDPPVPTRLGWSVFTVFFFLPLGSMALLYSMLAEIAHIHQRPDLVRNYAIKARNWRVASYLLVVTAPFIGLLLLTLASLVV